MRNSFNGSAEIAGLASAAASEDEATTRKFRLFTLLILVCRPTGRLKKSNFIDKNSLLHRRKRDQSQIERDEIPMADRRLRLGAFMRPVGIDTGWWRYFNPDRMQKFIL